MTEIYCADHTPPPTARHTKAKPPPWACIPSTRFRAFAPNAPHICATAKLAEHCADASRAPHAKRARAIATHPPNRHGNAAPWPMRAPGQCSAGTRLKQFATSFTPERARAAFPSAEKRFHSPTFSPFALYHRCVKETSNAARRRARGNEGTMINQRMYELGSEPSAIRELFAYGQARKAEIGEDNVFDFSIGNPSVPGARSG